MLIFVGNNKTKDMTTKKFLTENRNQVITYFNENIKGYYNVTLNSFMVDLMNNFRKITIVDNLTKTDLSGNLIEAESRLGMMDIEIELTYSKPYSESNHAKQINYFGKEKVNQLNII